MKALIIGKNGQLAWELAQTVPPNFNYISLSRNEVELSNINSVEKCVKDFRPDVIINASAYTAVDNAELDKKSAFALNEIAVNNLAIATKLANIRLIHISTDFVFDGAKNTPYNINDDTNPINVYGQSKSAGEKAIQKTYPDNSAIIRTSWLYSSHGTNFVKTMLKLMREKSKLKVVSDQIGCPTYARDLAGFIWRLCSESSLQQIYHWSDAGCASWYDYAMAIKEVSKKYKMLKEEPYIQPVSSSEYPTKAQRPYFSLLNTEKSVQIFPQKYWRENLELCISKILT